MSRLIHLTSAAVLVASFLVAPITLGQAPLLRFENLDGAPFPDRLVMSRIGTLASPPPANGVHDVSKVRLHNDGTGPLTVSSLSVSGAFELATSPTLPLTVAAGGSTDVSVRFIAESGTQSGGTRGPHLGYLTIGSDDPSTPSAVVTLRGYWQNLSENNKEPSLVQLIEQLFGYGTKILRSGESVVSQGRIERVGDEVISPFWRAADPDQPVSVQQLAAYHVCCTDGDPLFWYERGTTATTQIVRHNAADGQTVLPRRAGSSVALAIGTFTPGLTEFGFRTGNEWSDPFKNDATPDDCSGGIGTCGQHVRFWPAKDPSGTVIPDSYFLTMDFAGINYDFNDNVYLISNIAPVTPVATSGTVRLNAGGPEVTTGEKTFGANAFATNGQSYTPTCDLGDIAGTTDDDLYRTELEPVPTGPRAFAYNVPVSNGPYTVRLHFAEIYWGSCEAPAATVGKRVFSVTVEGQSVLTNLDIFAEVGVRAALVKTFQTTVTGNMLNVSFLASANNPMLSAIEIVPGGPTDPSIVVDGNRGFRYLGTPSLGVTVDDLAAQNLVRGVPGYYPPAIPPNLYTSYDATSASWNVSAGTGEVLTPGQAFRWFMYDRNVGNPAVSRSVELPFTLSTDFAPNAADVTVELQTGGSRFNYLANPFGVDLDVTGIFGWPGGDNVAPIFGVEVFDDLTLSWKPAVGSIAPWAAFRIRAKGPFLNGDPRTLTIPASATLSGAQQADRQVVATADREAGVVRLAFALDGRSLDGQPLADRSFAVAFTDDARTSLDEADAPKSAPLAEASLTLGARIDGRLVGVDARPFVAGEVPLALDARGAARELTLSWDATALPAGLPVTLVDLATGAEVDVRTQTSYAFQAASRPALSEDEVAGLGELADGAAAMDRFVLRIGTVLTDAEAVRALALTTIAPNPLSSTARVAFDVPTSGRARVSVVDVRGREVAVLVDGVVEAGRHEAVLDGSGLAAGVYLVRLEADGRVVTRQAAVVR
ncbi:malectin domain-containing carbohydrate-binding protein [Rubrivirga marina]|uniref:Malectin domain-containing protein n=1 Tax=Rubrivirga marina TaxID=1196024 RepID=A0A271IYT0_9BACT|nr:malectin domain-containing carbohydrate-binding protein [Rubrivirga marina]PAP75964.1 hypothetical protein BSZ37_05675 [Rubrivirga marina]